jgi:ADP-heptose:LPS heptosyltransferase
MKKLIKLYNNIAIYFRKNTKIAEINKVLIVSNTALGDTLLSTPAIKSLRKSYPNIYIELLVNKSVYSLFNDFEYVNKVSVYDKSLKNLLSYSNYLKEEKFDTIFFLHSNGPEDLFLALKSKVPNILKALNYPSRVSNFFMRFILNKPDYKNVKHIIEHRIDLLKEFNPLVLDKQMSLPKKYYIERNYSDKIKIGIQLSAADTYKMWPKSNFIKMINKINNKFINKIEFIFFGIEKEMELNNEVIKSLSNVMTVNLSGKTKIEELPKKLNELDLLITNDTGTLHLAIALKVPTISLFSPTDSRIFGPYQDTELHIAIQKDGDFINNKPKKQRTQEAMELITVDEVVDIVISQLKRLTKCVE